MIIMFHIIIKPAQWVVALGGRNAAEEQVNSEIWDSVFIGIIKQQLCRQPKMLMTFKMI